jgi:D-aminopeptidase
MSAERQRLRSLGISVGTVPTGRHNAITDVAGVSVGHTTVIEGKNVRTGVTAILPRSGNIFEEPLIGGHFVLNGAGEISGLTQLSEWGLIETPILLTNTLSVGAVSHGTVQHMVEQFPGIGSRQDVVIPLVGECDDSFLNDIAGDWITSEHVYNALNSATDGPVEEGSVGSGTGMVTCDLKAGIGTSSRVLPAEDGGFTVGILVMSNFGRLEDLRVDGMPVGPLVKEVLGEIERRRSLYGSIIAIIATDAPLTSRQINRVCKRVALGIGRVGSYAAHGSGEIILGFSTAQTIRRGSKALTHEMRMLDDTRMNPLYRAAIECTEEAILNALCASNSMTGVRGNVCPALPLDVIQWAWREREERWADAAAKFGRP